MHETLTILQKDVRRLWWQIAIPAAMSAALGCLDALRASAQPGILISLLNVLLPLAWASLIAQAILQDPPVGDREFWMTRPYRWERLLGAKALFVALCVHLPSFLTDMAVLAARGFNPLAAIPELLAKQLLLAGGLTLPAMALAAVVSNLTQFVIGIPILLLPTAVWAGLRPRFPFGPIAAAVLLLAVVSVSILLLQYRQRRTGLARTVAVLGGLAAAALGALGVFAGIRTAPHPFATHPAADSREVTLPTITPATGSRILVACFGETNAPRVDVVIPIAATGFPKGDRWGAGTKRFGGTLSIEMTGPNGVHLDNRTHVRSGPGAIAAQKTVGDTNYTVTSAPVENEMFAGWSLGPDGAPNALSFSMSRDAYDRLTSGKVTVAGSFAVNLYEAPPVRLRVGEDREVPGIGRCSVRPPKDPHGHQLTVVCESPSAGTLHARVAYEGPLPGGDTAGRKHARRTQEQVMEGEYRGNQMPLSPLYRSLAYLSVGDPWTPLAADQAVVLVQRISARATAEVRLMDLELPDSGHCRGR